MSFTRSITQTMLTEFQHLAANYIQSKTDGTDSVIIGVSRGGLIPAVYISHLTDIPMIPVDYSAEAGRGTSSHTNIIPPIDKYTNVFIVDDIVDSGITVKHLKEWFEHKGHIVHVLAVVHKTSSCIIPEYKLVTTNTNEWIIFPWEKYTDGQAEKAQVKENEGTS